MSGIAKADAQRLMLMLSELRLPATRATWHTFTERDDAEQEPAGSRVEAAFGDLRRDPRAHPDQRHDSQAV